MRYLSGSFEPKLSGYHAKIVIVGHLLDVWVVLFTLYPGDRPVSGSPDTGIGHLCD